MSSKAAQSVDSFIAGRMRAVRVHLGISQAEIAKKIGVSFQQIQKYEAGINRISAGRLFQFAECFGISVLEFFPKSSSAADGKRKTEKLDEMAAFAATSAGTELCQAFLRILDPKKRKLVISLAREMANE